MVNIQCWYPLREASRFLLRRPAPPTPPPLPSQATAMHSSPIEFFCFRLQWWLLFPLRGGHLHTRTWQGSVDDREQTGDSPGRFAALFSPLFFERESLGDILIDHVRPGAAPMICSSGGRRRRGPLGRREQQRHFCIWPGKAASRKRDPLAGRRCMDWLLLQ
ncbi:uncharacterized protein LY79DRAFT_565514 [Colletotrichum navitas]|uniref:Uncharacterized protein n=1 Tax=Colletotrichum navitas TaxID=681940 RepID=A0AAD8PQT0_9PEZI|nr:uncharacterized protein LY79DRAFT_565514 [Colletotrichum navitas]KAK1574704.1 hypothetical protein LY79DRAFT_565514 [Colletotrichum navitas]